MIVDIRANGGGSPHMVALVTSYLFGNERVHLNSLYFRPADRTDDFYTDPSVAGRKFGPDKPVYVLTSARTFSGAEEFAYNLQTRKRAIIVGETTGGGAHPGEGVSLPHGLMMFVPTGRAINPITKTNWEGVGVRPDVPVAADAALEKAHQLARNAVARRGRSAISTPCGSVPVSLRTACLYSTARGSATSGASSSRSKTIDSGMCAAGVAQQLSRAQFASLEQAGKLELLDAPHWLTPRNGAAVIEFELPFPGRVTADGELAGEVNGARRGGVWTRARSVSSKQNGPTGLPR
jgi:hypothetical protein